MKRKEDVKTERARLTKGLRRYVPRGELKPAATSMAQLRRLHAAMLAKRGQFSWLRG